MKVQKTPLDGLMIVQHDVMHDERGGFFRAFCHSSLKEVGVDFSVVQISVSQNLKRGTLRGMHWQAVPHLETKILRVTRGRIFDVAVDLRPHSATRFQWFGIELHENMPCSFVIPPGFAHGFVTLEDHSDITYLMDTPYVPGLARGVRYDDPRLAISWPLTPLVIAEKDKTWPLIEDTLLL